MIGYIHSIETCGTLDGPGLRCVVFFQGCPLKCKYCHNPDTWKLNCGKQYDSEVLVEEILRYKNFIRKGGVTLSGGEPLLQADFATEILKGCKKNGIHTAIDTSGAIPLGKCKNAVDEADMVLLDIKSINNQKCIELTGMGNENALNLLDYLENNKKEVWIRHVIVPGFTEDYDDILKMAKYLSRFQVISCVEILAFNKMGEYKWKELCMKYDLEKIPPPTRESILKIKEIFRQFHFNVV